MTDFAGTPAFDHLPKSSAALGSAAGRRAETDQAALLASPQGVQRLTPFAHHLHTDFTTDIGFDNPRATQVRLRAFDLDALIEVGRKVRDIYAAGADAPERTREHVDNPYLELLTRAVSRELGNQVGAAPRVCLKKLIDDVLDGVDQFPDFDPRQYYRLTVVDGELTEVERSARRAQSADDIELTID